MQIRKILDMRYRGTNAMSAGDHYRVAHQTIIESETSVQGDIVPDAITTSRHCFYCQMRMSIPFCSKIKYEGWQCEDFAWRVSTIVVLGSVCNPQTLLFLSVEFRKKSANRVSRSIRCLRSLTSTCAVGVLSTSWCRRHFTLISTQGLVV